MSAEVFVEIKKNKDLVAGSCPPQCLKMFFSNFTWEYRCTKLSWTVDTGKVQQKNKAVVEIAIREFREGEKYTPVGLCHACLGFE